MRENEISAAALIRVNTVYTGDYRRIQENIGEHMGIQENTGEYKRIQENTGKYRGIQGNKGKSRRIQGNPRKHGILGNYGEVLDTLK